MTLLGLRLFATGDAFGTGCWSVQSQHWCQTMAKFPLFSRELSLVGVALLKKEGSSVNFCGCYVESYHGLDKTVLHVLGTF